MLSVILLAGGWGRAARGGPFYGAAGLETADSFLAVIDHHVREIASAPDRFPKIGGVIQRCVVRKYPFIIFFKEYPEHIRILAVAHTSRHPNYWQRRN
jgi:toxin ParE1/3/4